MQLMTTLTNFFLTFFVLLIALLSVVKASPATLAKRDVFVPPVLYPHNGTQWYTGQQHNVTWDTSNHPVNITNKLGRIFLRKDDYTTPLFLAENFDILLGRIEVTVPWVVSGDSYQVVVMGDSGNFSPYFSIN